MLRLRRGTNPASRPAGAIAAFHAMMAHLDHAVGRMVAALAANGLADSTVIVFTSDHGELLGDHGMLHKGPFFFDPSIRVPMIWRFPDDMNVQATVDTGFAASVDIAPTVAELAGVPGPHRLQGQPLFDRNGTLRPVPARTAALTEWRGSHLHQTEGALWDPAVRCLVTDDWKYVHYEGQPYGELYDRRNDPHEIRNLWADPERQATVREMRDRLFSFVIETEPLPVKTDLF